MLLPCRDAVSTLRACIRSLSAQTVARFEVLAVDDGSVDGTLAVLESWAEEDDRVRVLRGTGAGPAAACSLAASHAEGPLMARMDADDVAEPRRLERQLRFLEEHPGVAACGTGVRYFPAEEVGPGYRRYERWINGLRDPDDVRRDLFVECPLPHPSLVIRSSVFRGLGGYRDMGWPEDYDLVLRLHAAGMQAANVSGTLLRWRTSPRSLSRTSEAYSREAFQRCKVHFLLHGFLPPDRRLVVWGAGSVGKGIGSELARQGRPPDAWVDLDPRKIGQGIHGAPVMDPASLGGPERNYVLAAVGSPGAREEIRAELDGRGFRELRDYRAVA